MIKKKLLAIVRKPELRRQESFYSFEKPSRQASSAMRYNLEQHGYEVIKYEQLLLQNMDEVGQIIHSPHNNGAINSNKEEPPHIFLKNEIREWRARDNTCPICRRTIQSIESETEAITKLRENQNKFIEDNNSQRYSNHNNILHKAVIGFPSPDINLFLFFANTSEGERLIFETNHDGKNPLQCSSDEFFQELLANVPKSEWNGLKGIDNRPWISSDPKIPLKDSVQVSKKIDGNKNECDIQGKKIMVLYQNKKEILIYNKSKNKMEKIEFDSSSMMEPYFIANVDPETNILSTKTEWKGRRLREPKWTNPIGIHQVLERRQKFRLIVFKLLDGSNKKLYVPLSNTPYHFGRNFGTFNITNTALSRDHARIYLSTAGEVEIQDCTSLNGTEVLISVTDDNKPDDNGEPPTKKQKTEKKIKSVSDIKGTRLRNADEFNLGGFIIKVDSMSEVLSISNQEEVVRAMRQIGIDFNPARDRIPSDPGRSNASGISPIRSFSEDISQALSARNQWNRASNPEVNPHLTASSVFEYQATIGPAKNFDRIVVKDTQDGHAVIHFNPERMCYTITPGTGDVWIKKEGIWQQVNEQINLRDNEEIKFTNRSQNNSGGGGGSQKLIL